MPSVSHRPDSLTSPVNFELDPTDSDGSVALQTAASNPAIMIHGTKDFGTVGPGEFADLVLLHGNPLEEIGNTQRISAVVVRGRVFRRNDLDRLLREAQELADQN